VRCLIKNSTFSPKVFIDSYCDHKYESFICLNTRTFVTKVPARRQDQFYIVGLSFFVTNVLIHVRVNTDIYHDGST